MKILITGGSGLLGQFLNISLSKENEILTIYNSHSGNCINFNSVLIDINYHEKFENIFTQFLPNIVIHTAAITTPQVTSSIPAKLVYQTNVNTTEFIAQLCEKYKTKMIYTSSDLVYAGYRGSMLNEDAKLIPVSLYAESKLMGEVKIREVFDNYLILRTSLLYGFGLNESRSHFQQMYSSLKEGNHVKLFDDQFRTPLSLIDAARMMNEICKLKVKEEIINFGGRERVSRLELGAILCDTAGFDKNLIDKISMSEIPNYPQVADVSMNTDKLQSYNIKAKSIRESIAEILEANKL